MSNVNINHVDHVNRRAQESSYGIHDAVCRSRAPSSDEPSSATPSAVINTPPQAAANAAAPARRAFFDPWNSSSMGHQRAGNRLAASTSWRVSRNLKFGEQYRSARDGGKRVADTVGAGSADFGKDARGDNGAWENGAQGPRLGRQKSLAEAWGASKAGNQASLDVDDFDLQSAQGDPPTQPAEKQIFTGLCFYVNGSTAPLVSDHKLKQLLALHGARHSTALGRRTVTHVILGTSNARGGAGGGLAATKIQKEIARTGGKAVKFITADWILESIKAGRRLPESRFSPLNLASKSQNSVFGMSRSTKQQDQG